MFKILQQPSVHIQDAEKVETIINNMVKDGPDHLQVISDFDRTLSGYKRNDHFVDTCHQALDHSPLLPADYRQAACAIRDAFYPIEIDPNLTVQEKIPHMIKWWNKAHELLVSCKFTRETVTRIVAGSNISLRDGCIGMFDDLAVHQVPLLIFSAGVGDIIEEVLTQHAKLHDNMKVVSNYMKFCSEGHLVGFHEDTIHVFNKNKSALHGSDYFQQIKSRGNIILLGDSLGDLNMSEGACDVKNILKIGFLNDNVDKKLEDYKSSYDIVLAQDETMNIPNAILAHIY